MRCEEKWTGFLANSGTNLKGIDKIIINGFHVAFCLFGNRSQMTSKCGKNKRVAHELFGEFVTNVLTTF